MNYEDLSFHVARALLAAAGKEETETHQSGTATRPAFTVTVSREVGAQGRAVAQEVGRLLGWPVYDQEILDKVAEELKRPSYLLRGLDERPAHWLDTAVAGIASDYHVTPSAYMKHLIGVIRGLGKTGHCVLVGRGAGHILPPATTLRVRLVGSAMDRKRIASQRTGLGIKEAARWMERTERERLEFVRNNFGIDAAAAHHYDLVLNTSRVPVALCARTIVELLHEFELRVGRPANQPSAELIGVGEGV